MLFQVDQVSSETIGHGEKNLINPEYIDNLSEEIVKYLGFGYKTDYAAFPNTSIATMALSDILELQKQLLPLTLQGIAKTIAKNLLPSEAIVYLKRIEWRARQNFGKTSI